jgi:hypothetical protein
MRRAELNEADVDKIALEGGELRIGQRVLVRFAR